MTCVFCEIAAEQRVAHMVLSEPNTIVFLDHSPLLPGHVLVVPREHHTTMLDLTEEELSSLFAVVQRVARAVENADLGEGTLVSVNNRISQSVPHVHVHVIPRRKGDGLRGFFWPRHKYAAGEAERITEQLREALLQSTGGKA